MEKRIQGALFGGGNPFDEIPRMLELYRAGRLKLDELVTTRYRLEEVNQGYRDMLDGRNIRGLLIHGTATQALSRSVPDYQPDISAYLGRVGRKAVTYGGAQALLTGQAIE